MSTHWRTTQCGTFEVVDRQGGVAVFFGGFMLVVAGCFLYWLGTAVVELVWFGTWQDVLASVPGMVVTFFMAGLFGVPGTLMALLSKRTVCNKTEGWIRQVTFFGVFRRARKVRLTDVQMVVAAFRTTRRSSRFHSTGGGAEVHTVEIVRADQQRVEVAQLGNWDSVLGLGHELAAYLDVPFREATG